MNRLLLVMKLTRIDKAHNHPSDRNLEKQFHFRMFHSSHFLRLLSTPLHFISSVFTSLNKSAGLHMLEDDKLQIPFGLF